MDTIMNYFIFGITVMLIYFCLFAIINRICKCVEQCYYIRYYKDENTLDNINGGFNDKEIN